MLLNLLYLYVDIIEIQMDTPENAISMSKSVETLLSNSFMEPPSKDDIESSIAHFIDRTSNAAVKVLPCAVCARETHLSDITTLKLTNITNSHLLSPTTPHPNHDIFNNMLLYPAAVHNQSMADICQECINALQKEKIPQFSLANNMWIGEVPKELSMLSLAERILVARYYPAAYIFKLFPKKKNAKSWDQSQMYSALKGNVSTYRLDPKQVAGIVDPHIMPPPAKILASTIGITILGPTGLPEKTMPDTFRVQRARIRTCLYWLKDHNPLYADIIISEENLSQLPDNGIPEELIMSARHTTDVDVLCLEDDGYVPRDAEDEREESK